MIYLATDHAGFELKEMLKQYLLELNYEVKDFGAFELDIDDDYPDFIRLAAEAVSKNPKDKAVILGGSGQGEAIVANRYKGVRAVVYYGGSSKVLTLSRVHNDSNVLSLGARFLTEAKAKRAVKIWLETEFQNEERHMRRIKKIDE
ncbi:MAG: ribose-5-phosphate isomerase [Candidatus Sungbacteria bacterium RIFCSPLOWO2_02_FULL_47_9]|nr:MAG: ribose-5-phosphate isomerase [Candidatus Sungbacteria bacterium RIFCSPLOWO2_02_FULL_47_9]